VCGGMNSIRSAWQHECRPSGLMRIKSLPTADCWRSGSREIAKRRRRRHENEMQRLETSMQVGEVRLNASIMAMMVACEAPISSTLISTQPQPGSLNLILDPPPPIQVSDTERYDVATAMRAEMQEASAPTSQVTAPPSHTVHSLAGVRRG